MREKKNYLLNDRIFETYVPHLFSNIEMYLNSQQILLNSPLADPVNSFDWIILTFSSWIGLDILHWRTQNRSLFRDHKISKAECDFFFSPALLFVCFKFLVLLLNFTRNLVEFVKICRYFPEKCKQNKYNINIQIFDRN